MATKRIRSLDRVEGPRETRRNGSQQSYSSPSSDGVILQGTAQGGYHDLDDLAGTWSRQDAEEFGRSSAPFSEIDPVL